MWKYWFGIHAALFFWEKKSSWEVWWAPRNKPKVLPWIAWYFNLAHRSMIWWFWRYSMRCRWTVWFEIRSTCSKFQRTRRSEWMKRISATCQLKSSSPMERPVTSPPNLSSSLPVSLGFLAVDCWMWKTRESLCPKRMCKPWQYSKLRRNSKTRGQNNQVLCYVCLIIFTLALHHQTIIHSTIV